MYLAMITLSLLGSIVSGLFVRKIGFSNINLSIWVVLTLLAAITVVYLEYLNISESIQLFTCIDSESLNVFWDIQFSWLMVPPVNPAVPEVKAEVEYPDAEANKSKIIKDNKGKSGVYRWTNKLNGKTYIGSSSDIGRRFSEYFRDSVLKRGMLIYKAILKYEHSNFSFEILEYCEAEQCVAREQDYINRLKPEYNLSPTAGMNLGYLWSEEQRNKKKEYWQTQAGEAHKKKLKDRSNWSKERRDSCPISVQVKVLEISTGLFSKHPSIRKAAEMLGLTQQALSKRFKTTNSFVLKGRYIIEKEKID